MDICECHGVADARGVTRVMVAEVASRRWRKSLGQEDAAVQHLRVVVDGGRPLREDISDLVGWRKNRLMPKKGVAE